MMERTIRFCAASMASLLLTVLAGSLASGQSAVTARPQAQAVTSTAQAPYSGVVTWGYLRLNHPEVIASIIRDVQAGKLPKSVLNGLASPAVLARLLKGRWDNVNASVPSQLPPPATPAPVHAAPRPPETRPNPRSSTNIGTGTTGIFVLPDAIAPDAATLNAQPLTFGPRSSPWKAFAKHMAGNSLTILPTYSPAALDFAPLYDKQVSTLSLDLTSPTDGPLTASLPADGPFKVVAMYGYDGIYRPASISHDGLSGKGKHVVLADAGSGLQAQEVVLGSQGVSAECTSPPWSMIVKAGQQVRIVVAFAPHFDLFRMAAGRYNQSLVVAGREVSGNPDTLAPWQIKVPINGFFRGVELGVLLVADEYAVEVVTPEAYNPREPQFFDVGVKLVNAEGAVTGTLRADALPPGVSMDPVDVAVAKNATAAQTLHFRIDRNDGAGIWNSAYEVAHPISVRYDYGGKTSWLSLSVTLSNGLHIWETGDQTCGSVNYHATLYLGASGSFSFNVQGYNKNVICGSEFTFNGSVGGMKLVNCGVSIGRDSAFYKTYGWQRSDVAARYLDLVGKPFVFDVRSVKTLG